MKKKSKVVKTKFEKKDEELEGQNKSLLIELWDFLKVRKAWWLIPIIVTLVFGGLLIFLGHSTSAVSPFIYPLF